MKRFFSCLPLAVLCACVVQPPARPRVPVENPESQESKAPPVVCPVVVPAAPVAVGDEVSELLAYYQRARQMPPLELAKEQLATAQRLAAERSDKLQLQQALLLSLSRGNGDFARALNLAEAVMNSRNPDGAPFKPLAALVWVQLNEQRRLAEQSERHAMQLREEQKRSNALQDRLDAAQQKLEGLKAIEKSLINRPQGTKP